MPLNNKQANQLKMNKHYEGQNYEQTHTPVDIFM